MILDRTNPDSAAEVIQKLIPEETNKKVCLGFLANSINIAHALSPDRWGVTLKKDSVRLNVGSIEVLTFMSEITRCLLDLDSISKELRTDERVFLFKSQDGERVELLDSQKNVTAGFYKRVSGSILCNLIFDDSGEILPLIQNSHRILVENASQTARQSMIKDAHSPAVIDYLSSYLGRKIPQPEY